MNDGQLPIDSSTARQQRIQELSAYTATVRQGEQATLERAALIARLYREGGWTQDDLAQAAKMSQQAVSKILNPGSAPRWTDRLRRNIADTSIRPGEVADLEVPPWLSLAKIIAVGLGPDWSAAAWTDYQEPGQPPFEVLLSGPNHQEFGAYCEHDDPNASMYLRLKFFGLHRRRSTNFSHFVTLDKRTGEQIAAEVRAEMLTGPRSYARWLQYTLTTSDN